MGEIRIIGGALRRRKIDVVDRAGLRPSPSRVRETLFNWLGQELPGWHVLDLFAGSGALGFEAASRGAARVVMIERDPAVLAALKKNRSALGLDAEVEIVAGDARLPVNWPSGGVDLVMADPPFDAPDVETLMNTLHSVVKLSGFLYLETPFKIDHCPGWTIYRSGKAGQVHYQLLCPQEKRT
jgi:16S rRNA (guanine966-N2)-methyltransferase